ncbi:Ig-like domain-containing protein [Chryseobacterium taihuense]|uniref:Por secretion system C-terminal sorting domain-containing protein n=1 Tax=Chryseobacterium taihuense TaxID=1141221 RepID=A0ABY0QQJ7_9FLAO|nr:T9SS type A sorting domain-containing protein [Chryseobacterium taihuense]SDL53509.1 Por secretion system C-terminal sorting domain-containing protein [Chryseobacterium taihuense]
MKNFYNVSFFKNFSKRILKVMSLASLLLSSSYSLNAQVKSYSFAQSTGAFTAITGGTVLGTATANSGVTSLYQVTPYDVTLPFNFNYNGTVYSSIKVSSNGYITFGTSTPGTSNSTPISSGESYTGAVSVFGKSLNTFANLGGLTGDIRTDVVGTAPNREVVIQWTNFRPAYSTSSTSAYAFSFQIRLKETSNIIDMVYNSGAFAIGSTNVSGSVQIGLRGASNSDFNNRLNASTLAFTSSTPGTDNTSTQYTSTTAGSASGMPPAGFTYTWTPPSCFAPTFTTSSSTPNSITVNWLAPTPNPGSYDVYYSTSTTAPTNTTTPTNPNITNTTITINQLAPATTYYVWMRSNCGTGNVSEWTPFPLYISTLCQTPALLTTTGATVCPNTSATLSATAETGAYLNWYDAATAGNLLGTGSTYTTPALTNTTNYWVAASNVGTSKNVGPTTPASLGASSNTNTSWDLLFTVNTPLLLKTVDVFSGTANQSGTIEVLNALGATVSTTPFVTTGAGNATPQTVTLNTYLPAGTYSMRRSGAANLFRNSAGATFPYTTPELVITGTTFASYPAYYFYFYNLSFTTGCGESPRQQVTATVDSAGCLSTSETEAKENITVHPNPFSEVIIINKSELVRTAKVMDTSGKLIKTIVNPQSAIRLQDLSAGLYILVLEMKDGSRQSIKVIKK